MGHGGDGRTQLRGRKWRALCLASINSMKKSCYLLRASLTSKEHLLGASHVLGKMLGVAESITTQPCPPRAPLWGCDLPWASLVQFPQKRKLRTKRGRVKAAWGKGMRRNCRCWSTLGQLTDIELKHE